MGNEHQNILLTLYRSYWSYGIELPNLETCTHVDIKLLWNRFKQCLQIGQGTILHTVPLRFNMVQILMYDSTSNPSSSDCNPRPGTRGYNYCM